MIYVTIRTHSGRIFDQFSIGSAKVRTPNTADAIHDSRIMALDQIAERFGIKADAIRQTSIRADEELQTHFVTVRLVDTKARRRGFRGKKPPSE